MSKDIWVYAETNNGKLCDIVPELLTKGRQLKAHSSGNLVRRSFSARPMSSAIGQH